MTPIAAPLAVASWLRRHRRELDLVVFHSYAGWFALASGAARGLRTVVAFHGLEPIYHQELVRELGGAVSRRYRFLQEQLMPRFLRAACRNAGLVTCLNSAEREYLVSERYVDPSRVAVVAHGVKEGFFAGERQPRPVATLLSVAQWLPMKGAGTVARAFTMLARSHPGLRLVCAGTLASADSVLRDFPEDVRGRVTVHPRLEQGALMDIYRQADIFVFPSSYDGFGLALVEAMASRLPIVTTNVGVAHDALADGTSALFVPRRDPGALAAAVDRLVADDGLRARLGAAAHAVAGDYREADRVREWADRLASVRPR